MCQSGRLLRHTSERSLELAKLAGMRLVRSNFQDPTKEALLPTTHALAQLCRLTRQARTKTLHGRSRLGKIASMAVAKNSRHDAGGSSLGTLSIEQGAPQSLLIGRAVRLRSSWWLRMLCSVGMCSTDLQASFGALLCRPCLLLFPRDPRYLSLQYHVAHIS